MGLDKELELGSIPEDGGRKMALLVLSAAEELERNQHYLRAKECATSDP